jgi:hypothetical protein
MSIIAKLMVRQVTSFGTGAFAELSCVCDNDLMAAYATSEEDKLFSRYSPWGEIRLHQRANWAVFVKDEQHVPAPTPPAAFYVMLLGEDEVGDDAVERFKRASAFLKVECHSKTKFAGDRSRVELREAGRKIDPADYRSREGVIERMSWKMHVDNPPAEDQFVPGQRYWAAFYDAAKFDRDTTIAAAHGRN